MTKPTIGFIGVGLMGHGMAKNILQGGYRLIVKGNRNRVPVDNLVSMGAQEAASPKEMAATCEMIHICLGNSPQVEAVIRGPNGILAGARKGLIVIDTSTANPVSTMALATEMAEQGVIMVDAPLGRTPKEAEAGTLDAMVGSDAGVFDTIRPVIECWAGAITRIGPVGSGHKMKLLMNFLAMSYATLYAEATSLAAKIDVPPETFRDVIGASRLGNGFFDTFMNYTIDRNRDAHKFAIANGAKDIRYVNAMAADAGVMTVMASAAAQYFTHAEAVGGSQDYVPMLSDYVARLNGIDLAEVLKK